MRSLVGRLKQGPGVRQCAQLHWAFELAGLPQSMLGIPSRHNVFEQTAFIGFTQQKKDSNWTRQRIEGLRHGATGKGMEQSSRAS